MLNSVGNPRGKNWKELERLMTAAVEAQEETVNKKAAKASVKKSLRMYFANVKFMKKKTGKSASIISRFITVTSTKKRWRSARVS